MESVEESSSPAPVGLDSETRRALSTDSNTKWYIKDIVIEVTVDNLSNINPATIRVVVYDSEMPGPGDLLVFEKTSPREWKYHGTIEVARQITLTAKWDETESFGIAHLMKSELEKLDVSAELPNQITRELITEANGPRLRLVIVPPDITTARLDSVELTYEIYFEDLSKNPELALVRILEIPDEIPHKPQSLAGIGNTFLARFRSSRTVCDIDNTILAYKSAVQLSPVNDMRLGRRLHVYGMSLLERYKITGNLADIEETISSLRKAAQHTPERNTDLPGLLSNLGSSFQARFTRSGNLADIFEAISCQKKSVELIPEGHVALPVMLVNLGSSFKTRFERTGDLADISEAISLQQKSIQLTPEGHAGLPHLLGNLGMSLETRFERTGDLADIFEAISIQQKAVQLTPENHEYLPAFLNNLGSAFQARFVRTGDLADLSAAISSQQRSIQLTPDSHANLPAQLNNLAISFQTRFDRTGNLADISEAISFHRKSIQLIPDSYADLRHILANLGISLQARFERTGDLADICEAISCHQKSLQLTPEGDSSLSFQLNNLGVSFKNRFECKGNLADISEAISSQRKSVQLTPDGHADLPTRLNNLGIFLEIRFEHTGDLADICEAVLSLRKSIHLTPKGYAYLPVLLNSLGVLLSKRFKRTGDLADISEAILSQQKSVQLTPEDHASLPAWLSNLGGSLLDRFNATGDLADMSESVLTLQKSIQLTPEDHVYILPTRLSNLGALLLRRFKCTGDLGDISEAISFGQQSVQLTPESHQDFPRLLNILGASLVMRFNRTGDSADIFGATSWLRKAVQLTPNGHADLPARLNNLGNSLEAYYGHTGELSDICEAISCQQKSVMLMPEGHAHLSALLSNLGRSFEIRFSHTRNAADAQSAIIHYRLSATSVSGPPSTRLAAAKAWAQLAQETDQPQLLEAYHTAIQLISQVAGLGQTIQKRYTNLIDISELSAAAAASAFDSESPDLALEWLEQGRCLVWSQLNDLRTPIDDLRTHDPALADEIVRVSKALENAGSRQEPTTFVAETTMTMKMSVQEEAHTHIKLAQEWEKLLVQVRAIPQFADFLRPASCTTLLKNIPNSGIVVLINIHQDRSDALALWSGAEKPLHIALPDVSYEKANKLRCDLKTHLFEYGVRMRGSEQDDPRGPYVKPDNRKEGRTSSTDGAVMKDVLCELWTFVVKPILDDLGYCEPASEIPRIWWCVTGPLAFLPIHAAGIYAPAIPSPGIHTSLSDFAVSSYTPTVRSIIEKEQSSRETNLEKMGLLMISQPDTPNLRRIPGTTVEVEAIKGLLANHRLQHLCLESGDATVNRVKRNMNAYSCIHFACHAAQDTTEPLQSGFYLYDGRLDLSAIIKEHLKGADLAFLSACQTSTGDEKLSEEAVHLAGGMLAAGYRGVVATMWSIQDSYGPQIAEEFYRNLVSRGADGENGLKRLSSDGAAYALHYATQQARKTLDHSEASLLTWVPFVHFGL